ncbi:MAG: hypothetical protein JSS11_15000 [Verrucomicrobia bacterium]|nr:hypothetical protein [Verrucomicrobiota bacterium]
MDDTPNQETPAPETPAKDFNKLDLSQLQGFSFGTQWSQEKSSPGEQRREREDRPRREDRRDGPGGAPDRRDRRAFRKPESGAAPSRPAGGDEAGERRAPAGGDRGPRREYQGQGGPRRDGQGGGYDRGGPRHGGGRYEQQEPRGPYESPFFNVAFYPEDTSFGALAKTIRTSCRTIELFEIARTVVGKTDRFVVVLTRKPAQAEGAAPAASKPIYISVPDGLPFDTEEAAVSHVLSTHLDTFFDRADVEVEPPKGNFQVINRCSITGELLGPPNYHRYAQIVQQHFAAKISRMSFDAYRGRIETVRDPEVVAQWLEKMKKTTRYTWKTPGAKPAPAAPAAEAAPAADGAPAEPAAPAETAEAPAASAAVSFDNYEDARAYLLGAVRDKVVRAVDNVRLHGKVAETLPPGEIRAAIEGALERQRRFPLDTANALRGRLRREHFTIFKKGSKGVSYVCAVKRKFRVPGQSFSETISALIAFIESKPMVRASELPAKFLNITLPAAPKAGEAAPASAEGQPVAEVAPDLTIEQRAQFARMQGDLRWLVTEGYVTEFIDGRLFAAPPMVEARKREVESAEHDPENFPEVPPDTRPPIPAPAAEPVAEAPAAEQAPAAPTGEAPQA